MPMKQEYPNLLQPGFHQFELIDLDGRFVAPFSTSTRRRHLLIGLISFIKEIRTLEVVGELWFDGSFVTEKVDPDDIDIVLILEESSVNSITPISQQKLANLLHNPTAKAQYNCDVYVAPSNDVKMVSYWRGWFGFKRDGKSPKGIGLVKL